jgi:hypothetical protein
MHSSAGLTERELFGAKSDFVRSVAENEDAMRKRIAHMRGCTNEILSNMSIGRPIALVGVGELSQSRW